MKTRYCITALLALLVAAGSSPALEFAPAEKPATVAAASDTALPLLKLELDVENNPGWVALVKGGYEWKLFRHVGYTVSSNGTTHSKTRNATSSGAAASLGFAYNFGEKLPVTLGLGLGLGPNGNINTRSVFNNGLNDVSVFARQKMRFYTLDLSLDYDFKKCGAWTPYVGLIGGLTFTSNKARMTVDDGGTVYSGNYNRHKRTNFVGGAQIGSKWRLNQCVTLSLYSSYEYLGNIKARDLSFDTAGVSARTTRVKAHQVDLKAGLRINF